MSTLERAAGPPDCASVKGQALRACYRPHPTLLLCLLVFIFIIDDIYIYIYFLHKILQDKGKKVLIHLDPDG